MREYGYSAASLARTYRAAKTWEPDAPFVKVSWCETLTAREWLRWFWSCLEAKIESHRAPVLRHDGQPARKLDRNWQLNIERLARAVNTPRRIVRFHENPVMDYRARLAHRFTED